MFVDAAINTLREEIKARSQKLSKIKDQESQKAKDLLLEIRVLVAVLKSFEKL